MSSMKVPRITSVDMLRGVVMILMALDHVRDFLHNGAMTGASPTDFRSTTTTLFLTRWITHFCAPVFALTAGLGAWFWLQNGRTRRQLSVFLVTRGLWLMLLEITIMRVGYQLAWWSAAPLFLLVFWSLGLSMIALAALVWLPVRAVAPLGVAIIFLHPLLANVQVARFFHQLTVTQIGGLTVISPYPLLPWMGVMALGFGLGPLVSGALEVRKRGLLWLGGAAIVGFVILRLIGWGDPLPRQLGTAFGHPVLGFINTSKYPASPQFLLMTLGPAFLALVLFDNIAAVGNRAAEVVKAFGRVPLMYYIVHFYLAHAIARVLAFATFGVAATDFALAPFPTFGGPVDLFPPNFGYDLWVVYVVWVAVIAVMYPLCKWYAEVRAKRHDWWLSYL